MPNKFDWNQYQAVDAAPKSGGKFDWNQFDEAKPADDSGFDGKAAVQGFGNMAAAGYVPELTGLVGKLLPDPNADADAKLKAQGFKIDQPEFKGMTTDESRAMQAQMAKGSPYSYYGGGVAGAVASAPMFSAALKGVGLAKNIAPLASDAGLLAKAANLGARAVQGAKEGALIGAVSNPNVNPGDEGFNLDRRASNAVLGGAVGGAAPVAADAIKGAASAGKDAAGWAGTKLLSSLGGVKPDVIKEYAQFSDRINSAPSVEALKEISDDFVGKLAQDVDAKKLTADQAQEAFKGLQSDLKDAYKTAGYDARDAVTSAQQTLKDAHNARLQQLSGDLYNTVDRLKSDVQAGSNQALETLNKSGAQIDLAPVYSEIDANIAKLKNAGTDSALSAANKLQEYKNRLVSQFSHNPDASGLMNAEASSNVSAPQAKKLIQGIDRDTKYSALAGSFDDAKNAAFKNVRSVFDQQVKSAVPEYAEAMKPVAQDADLLGRVSNFGDKQTAVGILGKIHAPNQMENRAALDQLGQKYGVDFVSAAHPESLPEQALLTKAQAAQEALRPDRVAEKIDQTLATSRQKAAFDSAQYGLSQAQDKLAPFKPLAPNNAGQTSAQQKLMQLGKGKNIELEDMFQKLGKLTGTDFVQAMKDQNTLAAFQKGATNGSRNTLMGALAGFAFGGVGGAAIGGSAGRAVDQWGPAITKKILDGAIKVSKIPSVATIRGLDLPDPLKRNMIIGLENYMSKGNATESAAIRAADNEQKINRSPAKGPDAWANKGAQNLGLQDEALVSRLMQSPQGKQLLIQASDLKPGSKAMTSIMNQIQKGFGKAK